MGRPAKPRGKDDPRLLSERHGRRAPEVTTDRRIELVEAAARVFATKGVGNTTMRDIADETGILAGSLYHHFQSKDALLEEVLRSVLNDLTEAYEAVKNKDLDPVAAVEELILTGLRFVTDQPDVTSIVQNDYTYLHDVETFAFVDEMTNQHRKIWRKVLERGVKEGAFRPDLDLDLTYRSMIAGIVAEVRWRRGKTRKPSAIALARQHSELYLRGLLAEN
jgi:TetR/AcrR family transcriptional regulator, cholesterol catabolism regulator